MSIDSNLAIGSKLCEIFNQPADKVQSITIIVEAGAIATVHISRIVHDDEAQQIYTLFEYFDLVKKGEHKQIHPQGVTADAVPPSIPGPDGQDWNEIARQALAEKENG